MYQELRQAIVTCRYPGYWLSEVPAVYEYWRL